MTTPTNSHTAVIGPFDIPNALVTVEIIGPSETRRRFMVRVVAVDPKSRVSPAIGSVLCIHQNTITPTVNWDNWRKDDANPS